MAAPAYEFPYHPDPLRTGSAVPLEDGCSLCAQESGFAYTGPVYGNPPDGPVCLECIRDGSALARLRAAGVRAEFTDVGGPECDGIPEAVLDEVACRTPGYVGWQQEHWLYQCGDGAAYLGRISAADLDGLPDARQALLEEAVGYGLTQEAAAAHLADLHPDGNTTAYLFRCRHCGLHLAYSDLA